MYTKLLAACALTTYAMLCFGCQENVVYTRTQWLAPVSPNSLVQEASQIIRTALADPDPAIRVNAIEVVATSKRIMLIPKVRRLLKDDFVPVRFAAVLAVGDLEYSLAAKSLTALLQDNNENVRIAALYALGKIGSPGTFEQIRKAIVSPDQTVRANAALLLGKSGDNSTLTRQALWWTLRREDSNDMVRFQTAESLAMLGDERIYPKLWTMLISAYADDRVMGIKAMGALGTLRAKDALITMLDDDIVEVRLAAAEQLGMLKDTVGEPVVLDVFSKKLATKLDPQSRERLNMRTALAIGRIGTPSLTRYLPTFLRDESKMVRIAAAMAVFNTQ
ncbi:MAG: HEAT repeat domain-containing protein [Planctomycetota bacterium]